MEDRISIAADELVVFLSKRFMSATDAGACLALTLARLSAATDLDHDQIFIRAEAASKRERHA